MNGDVKGAIEYMRAHEEFKDILPAYVAIFENCQYRTYDVPDILNDILRLYQIYFRDIFYCDVAESVAADKLLTKLKELLARYAECRRSELIRKASSGVRRKRLSCAIWKNTRFLRPLRLARYRPDNISRRTSERNGGIYR